MSCVANVTALMLSIMSTDPIPAIAPLKSLSRRACPPLTLVAVRNEPVETPQRERQTAQPQQGLHARRRVIQQHELPREYDDRDEHDDANLNGARSLANRQDDRVIEFHQDDDSQDMSKSILKRADFHELDP